MWRIDDDNDSNGDGDVDSAAAAADGDSNGDDGDVCVGDDGDMLKMITNVNLLSVLLEKREKKNKKDNFRKRYNSRELPNVKTKYTTIINNEQ